MSLLPGHYRFEAWGASGFLNNKCYGTESKYKDRGRGAYTSGIITLSKTEEIFVYVGETGNKEDTFNGGNGTGAPGGGATDFRLQYSINWFDFESLKSRIMVAAGGGGSDCSSSGDGGTINGFPSERVDGTGVVAGGGTQTSGGNAGSYQDGRTGQNGRFGIGGLGECGPKCDAAGSGGSGYYGGGGTAGEGGGGGGSSFISGHPGCLAILKNALNENELDHSNDSIHFSNLYFNFTIMKAGNEEMPKFSSSLHDQYTMIGNRGNGHARITFLDPLILSLSRHIAHGLAFRALLFTCFIK